MFALASPGEVGGVGKLERASRKGGMLASSCPVPVPGCIDLIPTMIMGIILPSPSSSPSAPPLPDPLPRLPAFSLLPFSVAVPNLNILKKLSGAWPTPGCPAVPTLCCHSAATGGRCRMCRPDSPLGCRRPLVMPRWLLRPAKAVLTVHQPGPRPASAAARYPCSLRHAIMISSCVGVLSYYVVAAA
jgi:hypothetical protein